MTPKWDLSVVKAQIVSITLISHYNHENKLTTSTVPAVLKLMSKCSNYISASSYDNHKDKMSKTNKRTIVVTLSLLANTTATLMGLFGETID